VFLDRFDWDAGAREHRAALVAKGVEVVDARWGGVLDSSGS
jgi:hypothetical protein